MQLWLSQRAATADLSGQEGRQHHGCKQVSLEERLENIRNNPTMESIEALKINDTASSSLEKI